MDTEIAGLFPESAGQAVKLSYGPRSLWDREKGKDSEARLELVLLGAFKCRSVTVACRTNLCDGIRKGTVL